MDRRGHKRGLVRAKKHGTKSGSGALRRGFPFAPDRALICPRIILLYAISTMTEIVIERWTNAEGETAFNWSVWDEGHRIQMGPNPHSTAEDCEAQALEFCWRDLGHKPDKVTQL